MSQQERLARLPEIRYSFLRIMATTAICGIYGDCYRKSFYIHKYASHLAFMEMVKKLEFNYEITDDFYRIII